MKGGTTFQWGRGGGLKSKRRAERFSWPQEFNFLFCLNILVWYQK